MDFEDEQHENLVSAKPGLPPPNPFSLQATSSPPKLYPSANVQLSIEKEESPSGSPADTVSRFSWLLVQISRLIPVVAAVSAVGYLSFLILEEENWESNHDAADEDKLSREKKRGTFVSVLMSILLNLIGALMFHIGVKEGLVVTNYGFILGPVIGFMLDQGIATDAGFGVKFTMAGVKFTFASLVSGNFMRYIITVVLDMFISNPLQDVLKRQAKQMGVIKQLTANKDSKRWVPAWYDRFVARNFPSLLQSIVAIITFNAYTNQTRFAWAYPATTLDRELRIPPGTIMLSTAIAGVLYLNFYTIMDTFSDREYYDVNTKVVYVMATLCLLYGLNASDNIEAPVELEFYTADSISTAAPTLEPTADSATESLDLLDDLQALFGFLLFVLFVIYGFVYPLYTRCGCCCCLKRTKSELDADQDHMIDEPELPEFPAKWARAFSSYPGTLAQSSALLAKGGRAGSVDV